MNLKYRDQIFEVTKTDGHFSNHKFYFRKGPQIQQGVPKDKVDKVLNHYKTHLAFQITNIDQNHLKIDCPETTLTLDVENGNKKIKISNVLKQSLSQDQKQALKGVVVELQNVIKN